MKKVKVVLKIFSVLVILVIGYIIVLKYQNPSLEINVVEEGGFSYIKIPENDLKTSLEVSEIINSEIGSSVCAVGIKHTGLSYSNGYYIWEFEAFKDPKLLPFELSSSVKAICNSDPDSCPCSNISNLGSEEVCYIDPTIQESRIYVNPYYLNINDSSSCEFSYDKSPLSLTDSNGNIVSSVNLPKNALKSEVYTVRIPVSQDSFNSGCFKSGLDIVKINELSDAICSTNSNSGFYIEGSSKSVGSKRIDSSPVSFYSIIAESVKEKDFKLSCYIDPLKYNTKVDYGFSILGQDSGYIEDLPCAGKCNIEKVLDTITGKIFVSYSHEYSFKELGKYKVICKSN